MPPDQGAALASELLEVTRAKDEDPECVERLRRVLRELRDAHTELGRLNCTHAAYLRRSNRTLEMLLNAVENYALTYRRPTPALTVSSRVGGS